MPKYDLIRDAVEEAVTTASIDWDAAREPVDERVCFDVQRLARVVKLTRTPDGLNAVVAATEEVLAYYLHAAQDARSFEFGCALAALRLQDRVTAAQDRWYRDGPNGLERIR